jgi:hypothetical protein
LFPDLIGKQVVAKFDQAHSSSDSGALLLKALDDRLGLSKGLGKPSETSPVSTSLNGDVGERSPF